ncbi:LTA synthase family protein [Acinetobacter larvae]|uniref:Sulfatase n=1 Tax=Acinetobacter larvae TaxID=1789224 RepID=A0A1B2LVM2_9GAMM|nr:alkaline phosphatase family protein [Acinetobacter larvae]AOA56980.1 sulfatase [Acinetobacter larvae]
MKLWQQQLIFLLVALLSVVIFFFTQEDIQRFLKFSSSYQQFRLYKYGFSIILNYALLCGFYLILRKTLATVLLSQFLIILLTFINTQKERYLSASLVPTDFFLLRETWIATPLPLKFGVLAIFALFIALFVYLYRKEKAEPSRHLILNVVSASLILGFFVAANFKNNFQAVCTKTDASTLCRYTTYLPNTRGEWAGDHLNIKNLGFSAFFFSKSIDQLKNKIYHGQPVSKEKIEQLFWPNGQPEQVAALAGDAAAPADELNTQAEASALIPSQATPILVNAEKTSNAHLPNIVFVMSESHWDAEQLDKRLPRNLTPHINRQQVSKILSPSFGGGTANVEFEVLTSLNVFMNQQELMYVAKIKRPIYSLANYFNDLGYQSTAMHNNGKYFYNRAAVYQHLGFHRFISIENMTTTENRKQFINQGGWATDDLIYHSIEQQLTHADQPQFIYAISVENHPMYHDDRFGKGEDLSHNPDLTAASRRQINTYMRGMQRADEKLQSLIDYAKTLERPTMIIFFGDHLPNLQKVYDEYHFFASDQQKQQKDQPKFFTTPLAVWSNFALDRQQFKADYIATPFLAPRLLTAAHLPLSPYYQYIQSVNQCYSAIHQIGLKHAKQCQPDAKQILADYQALNDDILYGKNYSYQLLQPAKTP